jgi:hypothetical protein
MLINQIEKDELEERLMEVKKEKGAREWKMLMLKEYWKDSVNSYMW